MSRFQNSSKLVQTWRYRWYVHAAFKWVWHSYVKPIRIPETAYDEELCLMTLTGEEYVPKGENLWSLLKGIAQSNMNWMYDHEDVMAEMEKYTGKSTTGCEREDPNKHGDVDEY